MSLTKTLCSSIMVTIRVKYSTFLLSSICFYLSWWIVNPAIAIETPKIRNFTQKEYQAAAQNWMISQTNDGRLFVANTDGLLEYDGTSLVATYLAQKAGINRILPLSNGWIAFGTIHEGVIITDQNYNLLYTVNKSNGLQNNTVLSLMGDQKGDLWVGLDKGISLLGISLPLSFYNDVDGKLGTVFCAMYHKGYEYLGTNQGLFYKTE